MAAPGLFDFLTAINQTKTNMLQTDDPEVLKAFTPFMIRRGLAQSMDTLVVAQRMNVLHSVDDWMQWNMALAAVPAKKRYAKWSKATEKDATLLLVSKYYYISLEKAAEYLKFLTPAQIEHLKTEMQHRETPVEKVGKAK